MKSFSASLVSAALLVAGVAAQDFQINTPNPPTQCVPSRFTWSGGQGTIAPGGVPGATAFQQYTGVTGTAFTWSTNISAGTSIGLTLTDSNGAVAQSAPVTIQAGPDSSCLNGSASQSGGSTPTTAGGSTGTTTGAAATTSAGTATGTTAGSSGTSGSTKPSGSSASGSATTSTTPTGGATGDNGAFSNVASMGVVGLFGAAAAFVLA
ncbi:hypothetical protein C8Q74DRAFT_1315534 [Fomes fomentarius]|nr:hypothetical protein C8Q74DRAFT_1315534 [Fomes fomentarius]